MKTTDVQEYSDVPGNVLSPIDTSHSLQSSMGYMPPQESPPIGYQEHQSLSAASAVSPIDTYRDGYETQYRPNQSYSVGAAPYPQVQSPPPIKSDITFYGGALPPAPPAGGAAADGGKKKKICGMTVTVFSLLCVILLLIIVAAVMGGGFGSGAWPPKPGPPSPIISTSSVEISSSSPTSTITSTTTTTTSTSTSATTTFPYPLPTGVWEKITGLSNVTGDCISNPTKNNYHEVWSCEKIQPFSLTVNDVSTTRLQYTIDIDKPVRARGVLGNPVDKGEKSYWEFSVPYTRDAFNGTSCPVSVNTVFFLGRRKIDFEILQMVQSPRVCKLPYGGDSKAGIMCFCAYI